MADENQNLIQEHDVDDEDNKFAQTNQVLEEVKFEQKKL